MRCRRFRKIPVETEGMMVNNVTSMLQHNPNGLPEWILAAAKSGKLNVISNGAVSVGTMEGLHIGGPSHWLMRGGVGELYLVAGSRIRSLYEDIGEA